jgi:hypothetical protein
LSWRDPVKRAARLAGMKAGRKSGPKGRRHRSHCRRGHEMTFENTLVNASGYFVCRECRRIVVRAWRKKRGS